MFRNSYSFCTDTKGPKNPGWEIRILCYNRRMGNKTIFLVDMNAFYASVHQAEDDNLKGKPVLVAGDREKRTGVVLAKSYECLKLAPIRTAMSLHEALALLPEAVVVKPDHRLYEVYARRTREVMSQFTPLVEPFSIDEAFMDMTGTGRLFGSAPEAARLVQESIGTRVGIPCSIGMGQTRIAAKMAAGFHKPMGISSLWPDEVLSKLHPLDVGRLFGIGQKGAARLKALNIRTIGDLAVADEALLTSLFGASARELQASARGLGSDLVDPARYEEIKSIGNSRTLPRDLETVQELSRALYDIAELVGRRIRDRNMAASTVTVQLKDDQFKTWSHGRSYSEPLCLTEEIFRRADELLREMIKPGRKIRLVGISLDGLIPEAQTQLTLFGDESNQKELEQALDRLRDRYGQDSIRKGRSILPGSLGDRK